MKKTAQILLIPSFLLLLFTTLGSHITLASQGTQPNRAVSLTATAVDCGTPPWTVGTEADLNDAITCYNEQTTAGDYTISLNQTITLITNTTSITNASTGVTLAINGDGHTIDGGQVARILNIQDSDVTVTNITITNGLADSITCTSGTRVCGGGIYIGSSGIVTISHTTIYTNSADFGGGIYNDSGTLTINHSTFTENLAGAGGALYNAGALALSNSTVFSHTTNGSSAGAGIFNDYAGAATAINNTFSANISAYGAGIYNRGTFTATNNTFFDNTSGIYIEFGSTMVATNNIIANSSPGKDCNGASLDNSNIDSDGSCGDAIQKTSAELNLGPLQDNGGNTWTHALLTGSHAIDVGNTTIATDQRGISRPQGSATDVGAYEFFDCDANPIPVTVETDLNTAIGCYNAKTVAGSYTISLTQSVTLITNTTTIDNTTAGVELLLAGNGHAIDGDNKGRGLHIESGVATLTDLTIQNGVADNIACGNYTVPCGGGIYIGETAAVTISHATLTNNSASEDGGAVLNKGTLVINNSTITKNSASVTGGGILNFIEAGNLMVNNSTFSENISAFSGAGINNGNVAMINNSTFYSNSSSTDGGGISNGGILTVTNSTFSGNSAEDDGGGVATKWAGESTLTNSTFSGNSADGNGGGIYVEGIGTVTLNNSIVANSVKGNDCSRKASGSISFTGSNLIEDDSCNFSAGSDPNLGPLQDNGGSTWTHALLTGSSAIDAGDSALATDQRGVARPQGSDPDIGAYELVRYDLAVSNDGDGNGAISNSSTSIDCGITCTAQIGESIVVTLTATAEVDSTFAGWSGDVTGSSNPITFTMGDAKNVTATFTFNSYTVISDTAGTGSGSITKSPDMPTYTHGTIITLTATADPDSTFSGWSGDVTGTTNPITLTVDAAKNVTATFPLNSYTITSDTTGTGSGSITKSPDMPTYTLGTIVTLTATADNGSTFSGWSGDVTAATDLITVTVSQTTHVSALFNLNSYTLTTNTIGDGSGTISRSPRSPTYTHGTMVMLTAKATVGSTFTGWSDPSCGVMNICLVKIDQAKTITATFGLEEPTDTIIYLPIILHSP